MTVYQMLLLFMVYVADDNRDERGYVSGSFNWCYRGSCSDSQIASRTSSLLSGFLPLE